MKKIIAKILLFIIGTVLITYFGYEFYYVPITNLINDGSINPTFCNIVSIVLLITIILVITIIIGLSIIILIAYLMSIKK